MTWVPSTSLRTAPADEKNGLKASLIYNHASVIGSAVLQVLHGSATRTELRGATQPSDGSLRFRARRHSSNPRSHP